MPKPKLDFDAWMRLVDAEIARRIGVTSSDLDDYCYRDAYDRGVSPKVVAGKAIKAASME